jgi:hypothetical protein
VATEININDILEANENQQKEILAQRKKELNAIKTKDLVASQKKRVEDAKKQVAFLESNIQKAVAAINRRRSQFGPNQPIDDLVQNLENIVSNYNSAVRTLNTVTPVARTAAMGGVPGAGRERTAAPVTPTGPTEPPVITSRTPAGTTVVTPTVAPAPTVDTPTEPTPTPAADKPTAPPKAKKTTAADIKSANEEQLIKAGINQAIVQYMKENYPDDWQQIKLLRDSATKTDGKIDNNEMRRIKTAFENTQYFKNAARENNRTTIGAYFILNGIDTASSAALIDKLTDDVYVTKVTTLQQAQAQIRRNAVDRLGLNRADADPNKRKIAQAMIDGGQAFNTAAADYVSAYTKLMGIPLNEFDLFEDQGFLNAFLDSTSLDDFRVKAKSSPTYTNTAIGRQEINAAKLRLQGLSRSLGLGYNPEQLEQQAANIVAGRQTYEQLEYNTRSIAGELFPMFKDRILAGESIANIAAPYTRSMASILELPESSLDVSDPNSEIRKALIGDGKTPKPLWQFEQELFKDARWQYTSNARDTVDRISTDILQRFGVMG